jgi:mono/diheme cytochrome c family protein
MAAKGDAAPIGPTISNEVIRHARRDRVLASFIDNIWTEVGRCAACHSPDRNQKQVKEHGDQVSWIKLNDPAGHFELHGRERID